MTAIALTPAAAYAQTAAPVTLETLIAEARAHNPELIAVRQKQKAAEARVTGAGTWDSPRLSAEYWSIPEGTFDVGAAGEKMYGISQMIPFPGKLRARGKAAGYDAAAMGAETRDTELRVLGDLKAAYAMYYALAREIETYRQTAVLMTSFSKVAEARYVAGGASQADVLRAQVEAEKMSTMVVTLEQEQEAVRAELNTLVGREAGAALGEPQDTLAVLPALTWNAVEAQTRSTSPEVARARAAAARSRWETAAAKLEYLPDFDVGYRRKQMNDMWAGSDFMVSATVPLWFWKQRAGVREMTANQRSAAAEQRSAELMAAARAKETFAKLEAARRLLELYRVSVLPKSEQAFKTAQASFAAGKMSFFELLDTVRSYLEFRRDYYTYGADYQKNLAALERIVGAPLGR
jgi:outer membrane protein TolC